MNSGQCSGSNFKGLTTLVACVLYGLILLVGAHAESPSKSPAAGQKPTAHSSPTHYHPNRFSKRAEMYYGAVWGIDSLTVRTAESGELIRFHYRVLDSARPCNSAIRRSNQLSSTSRQASNLSCRRSKRSASFARAAPRRMEESTGWRSRTHAARSSQETG